MTPEFLARMRELDDLVEKCREHASFAGAVVRDTSNRYDRELPWWSVQVEHTEVEVTETRRVYASIELDSTASGYPGSFKAVWWARIWQGVGVDSLRVSGNWPLDWDCPTAQMLQDEMNALISAGQAAINKAVAERQQQV